MGNCLSHLKQRRQRDQQRDDAPPPPSSHPTHHPRFAPSPHLPTLIEVPEPEDVASPTPPVRPSPSPSPATSGPRPASRPRNPGALNKGKRPEATPPPSLDWPKSSHPTARGISSISRAAVHEMHHSDGRGLASTVPGLLFVGQVLWTDLNNLDKPGEQSSADFLVDVISAYLMLIRVNEPALEEQLRYKAADFFLQHPSSAAVAAVRRIYSETLPGDDLRRMAACVIVRNAGEMGLSRDVMFEMQSIPYFAMDCDEIYRPFLYQ